MTRLLRIGARAMVALLLAGAVASAQPTQHPVSTLAGTSWQLVQLHGGNVKPVVPSDKTKYTIEFQADGRLRARIDCNGGRGRWASAAAGQIEFGGLGLTKEKCAAGSLQDRIVRDWVTIRSYAIKANHLFLAVAGGSATYEFRPLPPREAVTSAVASVGPVEYQCDRGDAVLATFYQTRPAMVLVERAGKSRPAFAVPAASGAKYEGKDLVFWEKGTGASVVWAGVSSVCSRR